MNSKALLMALMGLALAGTAQAASHTSHYTTLTNCKVIGSSENEPEPEIDWFKSVCPGREGFDVIHAGGDARSWIGLVKKGASYDSGVEYYEQLMTWNFGQFPTVAGEKLEWRYVGQKLTALIVRTDGYDPDADKTNQGLVVLRVDLETPEKACVIGQTTSNAEARRIADDAKARCL